MSAPAPKSLRSAPYGPRALRTLPLRHLARPEHAPHPTGRARQARAAASFRAEKMAALPELARSAIGERLHACLPHNCYSIVDAEIAARAASMRGCVQ